MWNRIIWIEGMNDINIIYQCFLFFHYIIALTDTHHLQLIFTDMPICLVQIFTVSIRLSTWDSKFPNIVLLGTFKLIALLALSITIVNGNIKELSMKINN
jgi:hypothetical protein